MLLWLDFETTGLSPIHNRVIEAGWTITGSDLQPRLWDAQGAEVVQHELVTLNMDTWAQLEEFNAHFDMHIKSGLYDDLKESQETLMLSDIEDLILIDIEASERVKDEQVILAGSGVHFDRDFIKLWMPRLAERLHYRLFDMSTVKRFVALVGLKDETSTETHRADRDVVEALANARQWRADLRYAMDTWTGRTGLEDEGFVAGELNR